MKRLALAVAIVLGCVGFAHAGDYSHGRYNHSYEQKIYLQPYYEVEVLQQHEQVFRVDPEPVLEVQKIERVVLPQQVEYYGNPRIVRRQKIRVVEKVRIVEKQNVRKLKVRQQQMHDYRQQQQQQHHQYQQQQQQYRENDFERTLRILRQFNRRGH